MLFISASGMSLGKLPADANKASQQIMKAIYENLINNSGQKSYNISGIKVVLKLTAEAINEKNALTGKTEVKSAFSGITLLVKGDTKEFWLATDKNYRIVFTGTGTGTMNYSIQQKENHEFTEQVDYYDVPLTEGIVYEQTVTEGDLKAGQSACDLVVTASGNRVTSTAHKDNDGNVEKVTFTSSNKKVATVSKTGKITAKKAGKAKITVKAGKKKVTVNVVVKK